MCFFYPLLRKCCQRNSHIVSLFFLRISCDYNGAAFMYKLELLNGKKKLIL